MLSSVAMIVLLAAACGESSVDTDPTGPATETASPGAVDDIAPSSGSDLVDPTPEIARDAYLDRALESVPGNLF